MKKKIAFLILVLLCMYLLTHPLRSFSGALMGLNLWFEILLPTLLPFLILSNLLLKSNLAQAFGRKIYPYIKRILPVSENGIFPMFAGFSFGFPVGSKLTADLYRQGMLSANETKALAVACNNLSPMFLSGFFTSVTFGHSNLCPLTLFCLYLPPLVYLYVKKWMNQKNDTIPADIVIKNKTPRSQINFKIIDVCIIDSFETITKIGGYLILTAIAIKQIQSMNLPVLTACILTGIFEVTNGITCTCQIDQLSESSCYLLCILYSAFGGVSGIAQTASMLKDTPVTILAYIRTKLIFTFFSGTLCLLFLY